MIHDQIDIHLLQVNVQLLAHAADLSGLLCRNMPMSHTRPEDGETRSEASARPVRGDHIGDDLPPALIEVGLPELPKLKKLCRRCKNFPSLEVAGSCCLVDYANLFGIILTERCWSRC